jgi:hypothetical protein
VHAVGDAAIDLVLEVLAAVDQVTPVAGLGFHLIHAYLGPSRAAMAQGPAVFSANCAPGIYRCVRWSDVTMGVSMSCAGSARKWPSAI